MAACSLVLAVLGAVACIYPGLFWLGIPACILALTLAQAAYRSRARTRLAAASLLLGGFGLVFGLAAYGLRAHVHNRVEQLSGGFDPRTSQEFRDTFRKLIGEPHSADGGSGRAP